jgi:predicted kinase
MATLHLIHGFIGTGKTSFAKKLEQGLPAFRLNNDGFMRRLYGSNPPQDKFQEYYKNIEEMMLDLTQRLLCLGVDVVIDDGFWTREKRDFIREFSKKHNAQYKFYYIKCDMQTAKQRVLMRTKNKEKDQLFIDENAFDELFLKYEPMMEDEDFELVLT